MQRTEAVDFKLFLNYNFWLALVLPKLHPLNSQRPVFYHSGSYFVHLETFSEEKTFQEPTFLKGLKYVPRSLNRNPLRYPGLYIFGC